MDLFSHSSFIQLSNYISYRCIWKFSFIWKSAPKSTKTMPKPKQPTCLSLRSKPKRIKSIPKLRPQFHALRLRRLGWWVSWVMNHFHALRDCFHALRRRFSDKTVTYICSTRRISSFTLPFTGANCCCPFLVHTA
jgi:hypothetical protein